MRSFIYTRDWRQSYPPLYAEVVQPGIRIGLTTANEVEVRPWMSFITVPDPDNHQIVFGTKNQIYYDQAEEQVKNLDP